MFSSALRRLGTRSTALVEFAIMVPLLLTLLLGTAEIVNAFRAHAKLGIVAGQLAQWVASSSLVTAPGGTLADFCQGAVLDLAPYPASSITAQIASLSVDHPSNRVQGSTDSVSVNAYLDWEVDTSCPQAAASPLGLSNAFAAVNEPRSLLVKSGLPASSTSDQTLEYGYSAIVVVVTYNYANVFPFFSPAALTFTGMATSRPRGNVTVSCTNQGQTAACPLFQ